MPEAHLAGDQDPLKHVIRGWRKVGSGKPRPLEENELESRWFLYLPGPLVDVEKMAPQTIDTGLGKLECQVETGQGEFEFAKRKYRGRFTVLLNDKPAFGVVRWKGVVDWQEGGERPESLEFEMTLDRQGRDARSELPERN